MVYVYIPDYMFIIFKYLFALIIFLTTILVLTIISYLTYDWFIKKLLNWKNPQSRSELWYFIKNREDIREMIKKHQDKTKGKFEKVEK